MQSIRTTDEYKEYELVEERDDEYFDLVYQYVLDMKEIPETFSVTDEYGFEFETNVKHWLSKDQMETLKKLL